MIPNNNNKTVKGACMFRSLLESPIKTGILVSEENPYLSHYLCKIPGQRDVAFRRYERKKVVNILEILYTKFPRGNFK